MDYSLGADFLEYNSCAHSVLFRQTSWIALGCTKKCAFFACVLVVAYARICTSSPGILFAQKKLIMLSANSSSGSKAVAPIRIVVADRNLMSSHLVAESLRENPDFKIIALAITEDISTLTAHKPDVALISMELDMASKKGLEFARRLHKSQPFIRIVILLDVSTRESVIAAFRSGATGVFCRDQHPCELRSCIERVSRGEVWARSEEVQYLLETFRDTPSCDGIETGKLNSLSKREHQVAELAAQGHSNKEIGNKLRLSEYTIKNHLYRIFDKLHISSRFELLFLVLSERHSPTIGQAAEFEVAGFNHPIETYLRAADEGFLAAQYLVGLAHLQGVGVEKNSSAAYYWLRMVEENSHELQRRTHALTNELRAGMKTQELEVLEHRIASALQQNRFTPKPSWAVMKRGAAGVEFPISARLQAV
jgi:two-component system, NarL family, nitrate/nitrite response regulator NarL